MGYTYIYKSQVLTFATLEGIVSNNTEVSTIVRKAKGTSTTAGVFAYIGGFLVGYPVGTLIGGGEPIWGMALVGCGIIAISIPIAISANTNVHKAIKLYNSSFTPPTKLQSMQLKIGWQQNGWGVALQF